LKPITKVKIERALQKVSQLMPLDLEKKNWVRLPSKGRFVEYEEGRIFQLKGQRNYTIVVLDNGEEILVAKTLKAFSQELSDRFKRIHKGTIVNGDKIKEVLWGSRVQVVLLDDTVVDASKERVQELGLDA
jgi:DNA-binding LytR/AlgR family response regulator